ncbi:alkaline phosphatase [Syntrophus gentianae]|uniref:Alkaline phosphatase n=1 Tax=Syntrophus gentianae TaxID=43775 RepID=A0A1H8B2E6_9BACT|nr:alkaline phosphatase [Syntrophus gentianae]SEM75967.1 alkaline phosphatase [Syntrophus gentianae]
MSTLVNKIPLSRIARSIVFLLALATLSCTGRAKNIILLVPDGMGLADVTAARLSKYGGNPLPLSFETLEHIGYQRTAPAGGIITDSAAAASAWACGEKFANGEICHHGDGRPHRPSILELAGKSGRSTGLVATEAISDATPAAFGAHVPSRRCGNEIARQYLEDSRVNVLLGGGKTSFTAAEPDSCGTAGNFLCLSRERGYRTVHDREGMEKAVAEGATKLLGLFADRALTPEYLRTPGTGEPRLPEMTASALKVLEKNPNGFFLLVEGSLVDKANHSNNFPYQVGEVLAFDEAVTVVRAWIDRDPKRRGETLLIVVPDHETGGFAITGPISAGMKADIGLETTWTGKKHTGVDTMIWSSGPGSERLGRALDNTDLYEIMADALK